MAIPLIELQILAGLARGKLLADIGRELNLGQPAISKALQSARNRLGIELVERRGKRLFLTQNGLDVAQAASAAIDGVDAVAKLADDIGMAAEAICGFWPHIPRARMCCPQSWPSF